jgi:hypothetical protein
MPSGSTTPAGLPPSPLRPRSKAPLVAGWPAYNTTAVDPDTLAVWVQRYPYAGIGHPAGHGIAFVDQDEDDPARATLLQGLVRELLGTTPLRRIGRHPREVAVYRRVAGSSMPSMLAAVPGLSLYLDSGQVALLATHPVTGRPYVWPIEDPTTVAPGDLPAVTDLQLIELLDTAATLQGGPRRRIPMLSSSCGGLATPVLEAMRRPGARALEVARQHVLAAEPGQRHYHLAGAIPQPKRWRCWPGRGGASVTQHLTLRCRGRSGHGREHGGRARPDHRS